ncbi:hypothetical protein TUBRATIS_000980 [Tubulinosema ratisbonensis]|uniref:Uncharacterized protein n=1 Tax=Tubulinosema ratisbonensis TaxID=291195 RepID=A0A437AQT5_9MICR|nr:hypothetical protein TUBRATIS_000980 [Tubulinosema ratisbonensis]
MLFIYFASLISKEILTNSLFKFLLISSEELENKKINTDPTKNIFIILKYTLLNSVYKIKSLKKIIYQIPNQIFFLKKDFFNDLVNKILILIEIIKIRFLNIKDRLTHNLFLKYLYLFFVEQSDILNLYLLEETSAFLNIILSEPDWIKELIKYSLKMIKNNPQLNKIEFKESIESYQDYL